LYADLTHATLRRRVKTLVLSLIVALGLFSTAKAADKAPAEPPAQFLQTDQPWWRRALATKITVDFRDAPMRDVIDYLSHMAQMNTVMKLDVKPSPAADAPKEVGGKIPGAPVEASGAASAPKNELKITRKFECVPLRTVYYQISLDTGLKIEWLLLDNKKPFGIMIRNQ